MNDGYRDFKDSKHVIIWWEISISIKQLFKKGLDLFCKKCFRWSDFYTYTFINLIHFKNPVHGSLFSFSVTVKPKRLVYTVFLSVTSL